jgi:hypothetical protein
MSEEDSQHPQHSQHPREDDRNDEVEGSPVPDPEQPNTEDEDTAAV